MTFENLNRIPTAELPRTPEKLLDEEIQWFAGALQVGGEAGIRIHEKVTSPYISIHEGDKVLMAFLQRNYGGSIQPNAGSLSWTLQGPLAAHIIAEMEPYLWVRRELNLAAYNWLQTEDIDERLAIAEEFKAYTTPREEGEAEEVEVGEIGLDKYALNSVATSRNFMDTQEYDALVIKYVSFLKAYPAFLAGILDHRGTIGLRKAGKSTTTQYVSVRSLNGALLDAIKVAFQAGTSALTTSAGTEGAIKGQAFVTQNDSFTWGAVAAQARGIIERAQPYLRVQLAQDWAVRKIDLQEEKRVEDSALLELFMEEDMTLFEAGRIDRMRTIRELAKAVGLNFAVMHDRLALVSTEIRSRHGELAQAYAKRVLTREDITTLQALITEELEKIEASLAEGNVVKFTSNEDWARIMKVSVPSINRHVMRTLPADIRERRRRLIRSTTMIARNAQYGNPFPRKS